MNKKDINFQEFNIKLRLGPILLDIILGESFIDPEIGFDSDIHKHFLYEVHYITKGNGTISIDDEDFAVAENSYFIIGPEIYHSHKDNPSNPINKYCFKFEYYIVNDDYNAYIPKQEIQTIINILSSLKYYHAIDTHNFISNITDIKNELVHQSFGYYTKLQTQFLLILLNIFRDIAKNDNKLNARYNFPNKSPLELRSKTIDNFFNKDFNKNVTSEDLSRLLYISKSQLNRILKKQYNTTFKQKLIEIRMDKAKKFLIMTNLSIQDISEKIGYGSAESFSLVFKQKFGLSPNAYRNKYKAKAK